MEQGTFGELGQRIQMSSELWSGWSNLRKFQVNISGLDASSFVHAYLSGQPIKTSQKAFMVGSSHIINAFLEGDDPRSSIHAHISTISTEEQIEWTMEEQLVGTREYKQSPWGWWGYETTTYTQAKYAMCKTGRIVLYVWNYWRNFPEVSSLEYERVKISTDYGQTYTLVSDIPIAYLVSSNPTCRGYIFIEVSDNGNKIIVAGSTDNQNIGFYLSTNGGTTFSAKMTDRQVLWACISKDGSIIYAIDATYKLHKSTNDAGSWTDITPSGGFEVNVTSVKTNYDGSAILLRGIGKAIYSTNGGSSWNSLSITESSSSIDGQVSDDGDTMAFMQYLWFQSPPIEQKNFFFSSDGGVSWAGPKGPLDFGMDDCNFRGFSLSGDGLKYYFGLIDFDAVYFLSKTWDDKGSFFEKQPPDMSAWRHYYMARGSIYHAVTVAWTNSDSQPVREVWIGREVLTSSIHAYIRAEEGSRIRGYLRGIGYSKDNTSAYTAGITYIDDKSQTPCYMFGGTPAITSQSVYMNSAGQILVPSADISNDDWKNESDGAILYPSIADDYDYTYVWKQDVQVNDAFEVSLSDPFGIVGSGDHYLIWKIINIGIEGIVTLKCEIYDGLTLVKSDTRTIETFPIEYIIKLTSGEVANISDYYNLTAKVTVVGVG